MGFVNYWSGNYWSGNDWSGIWVKKRINNMAVGSVDMSCGFGDSFFGLFLLVFLLLLLVLILFCFGAIG